MFQTTRRRLALWYTTITAILLLLFASGVYVYVRGTLIERIDDTLNHVVEVVRRSLVIEPVNPHSEGGALRVNLEASLRDSAATDEDDHIDIEWFSPMGELLWSTLAEPFNLPLHVNSKGETVRVQKAIPPRSSVPNKTGAWNQSRRSPPSATESLALRQITQRVEVGRNMLGYLRVSHPWFEVTKPSREFFLDLILGMGLMIAAVGASGWFLSGLAMEPVRESYQRLKQFTADASHELRSPIAVIQTNVQVALADPDPDLQVQQHHLRVVERLTRRLGRLVDDLLFLARQDSGIVQAQWMEICLEPLLQEVVEEQQTLADEKSIPIAYTRLEAMMEGIPTAPLLARAANRSTAAIAPMLQANAGCWTLKADRDQLTRLFTNLLSNAVYYTPAGGKVAVQLQRVGRPGSYGLQVTVSDTGVGIAPEAIPQVFDRFYRADLARSQGSNVGSGLGLAIAQAIVQNHHGQIQLESTVNQGTTVTVILPQREDAVS